MSILEGMVKNTKFVFHTSQTQSKEEIVLDRQQFSVLGEKKEEMKYIFILQPQC